MSKSTLKSWKKVQDIVLNRIKSRQWAAGMLIPNEEQLALELGVGRTTVNRALRAVAEAGFLDRKRRAGTKVAKNPTRKATITIPIIRKEIEETNQTYSYTLIKKLKSIPSLDVRAEMGLRLNQKALNIESVHYANNRPYAHEDRWINLKSAPEAQKVDFEETNANEWLIANVPFVRGDLSFYSTNASAKISKILNTAHRSALLVAKRITWNGNTSVTSVKLTYHFGYEMRSNM